MKILLSIIKNKPSSKDVIYYSIKQIRIFSYINLYI